MALRCCPRPRIDFRTARPTMRTNSIVYSPDWVAARPRSCTCGWSAKHLRLKGSSSPIVLH
eukprot:8207083-Heterocapsa_arctica.AAC.1